MTAALTHRTKDREQTIGGGLCLHRKQPDHQVGKPTSGGLANALPVRVEGAQFHALDRPQDQESVLCDLGILVLRLGLITIAPPSPLHLFQLRHDLCLSLLATPFASADWLLLEFLCFWGLAG